MENQSIRYTKQAAGEYSTTINGEKYYVCKLMSGNWFIAFPNGGTVQFKSKRACTRFLYKNVMNEKKYGDVETIGNFTDLNQAKADATRKGAFHRLGEYVTIVQFSDDSYSWYDNGDENRQPIYFRRICYKSYIANYKWQNHN